MDATSRTCRKCNVEKLLEEFSRAPRGKYGRKASCKACDAARAAEHYVPKPRTKYREAYTGDEPKTCRKCGETKPLREFRLSRQATNTRNAVYRSDCKTCSATAARRWFAENKERHKETRHRHAMRATYGLTPEQYQDMLAAQGGVCAICGLDEPNAHGRTGTQFRLSVDHCHDTGRVRGLLCQKCNRAIGLLGDNVDLLRKAIAYLGGS
jgi:hypothetical protein